MISPIFFRIVGQVNIILYMYRYKGQCEKSKKMLRTPFDGFAFDENIIIDYDALKQGLSLTLWGLVPP